MSLSFWGHVCMCVPPRVSVCLGLRVLRPGVCAYLCEGKRAFVFEVWSMSVSVSIGRSVTQSVGRLALAFSVLLLFLDARKNCKCLRLPVCVCGCANASILLGGD